MEARELKGLVYRVRTKTAAWLVEVPDGIDPIQELVEDAKAIQEMLNELADRLMRKLI